MYQKLILRNRITRMNDKRYPPKKIYSNTFINVNFYVMVFFFLIPLSDILNIGTIGTLISLFFI